MNCEHVKLVIGGAKIKTKNKVKLLGITLDKKLNFEENIYLNYAKKPLCN